MYAKDEPPLLEFISNFAQKVEVVLREEAGKDLILIKDILNTIYDISKHYMWLIWNPHFASLNPRYPILFSTFHKNLFTFYSAYELTKKGLFGPARPLLRYSFESLMISKFCSLSKDENLFDRWEKGETIYFSNSILKKIVKPDVDVFKEFWKMMCQFSHATIYAQQVIMNWEENQGEILSNLVFLKILLECQYHLLTSHIVTSSMQYYAEVYSDIDQLKKKKSEIRELFKESKKSMLPIPKKIISSYKNTWTIKT